MNCRQACGGRRGEILLREGIVGFVFVPWREKEKLWVPRRDKTRAREWIQRPDRDWNLVEAYLTVVRFSTLIVLLYFYIFGLISIEVTSENIKNQ